MKRKSDMRSGRYVLMASMVALVLASMVGLSTFVALSDTSRGSENASFTDVISMTKVFWAQQREPKEIEFRSSWGGENLMQVSLFSPQGKPIFANHFYEEPIIVHKEYNLVNDSGQGYYKIGDPPAMEQKFPLGDYEFRVKYYDPVDSKTKQDILISSLYGPFPPRPIIVYPQHDATGIELAPLIQWDRTTDDARFLHYFVHIGIPVQGTPNWIGVLSEQIEDINTTHYQVPVGVLQTNTTYHVWVGVSYEGILESKSGVQFTTVP
jgi:hypothetical protein